MINIKKFEEFDFSQTIQGTTLQTLINYYKCDDCNALYKQFNEKSDKCKFCHSDNIDKIDVDEWYDLVRLRLDEDEIEDLNQEKEKDETTLVDLLSLRKNPRRNVN